MINLTQHKSASNTPLSKGFANSVAKLFFIAVTSAYATSTMADAPVSNEETNNTAYVDSIHQWGPWELDIEPAAGGLQQASTQALNARTTKISLRSNSVAALAPQRPATPAIPAVPATPPTPAIPATPATPPRGGPADGLF